MFFYRLVSEQEVENKIDIRFAPPQPLDSSINATTLFMLFTSRSYA